MTSAADFQVRVITDYVAPYPDPIQVRAGDEVSMDMNKQTDIDGWVWCTNRAGKSGWAPTAYVELQGSIGRMRVDYSAIELTIHTGDMLTVHKMESSFYWVTDQSGSQGWVPIANVETLEKKS